MATPEITVLIANFNAQSFIERAIQSALRQSIERDSYEIVVADDGSTDGSLDILKGYGPKLRVLRLAHAGLPAACNAGIESARGEYLIRLDSDDELEPEALAELSAELDGDPKAAFVTADRTDIDAATGEKTLVRVDPGNMYDLIAPGVMFRRQALVSAGLYDKQYWEEYDLFLRILLKSKARHVSKPLYRYWRHSRSMTANAESRRRGWEALIAKWGIEKLRLFGGNPEMESVYAALCQKAPLT